MTTGADASLQPFADFAPPIRPQSALRQAITAAYRVPEPECVSPLVEAATLPDETRARIAETARTLIEALRAKAGGSGVEGLVQEYSLSSQEGVALMCLAEALLRIPDSATRDALIRDKIARGDWRSHVGDGQSLFVNAATWGLVVTGKLTNSVNDTGLAAALALLAPIASPSFTGTVTQPTPSVLTAATTATSATAGAASALPATPLGYLEMTVNSVTIKVPYYSV